MHSRQGSRLGLGGTRERQYTCSGQADVSGTWRSLLRLGSRVGPPRLGCEVWGSSMLLGWRTHGPGGTWWVGWVGWVGLPGKSGMLAREKQLAAP